MKKRFIYLFIYLFIVLIFPLFFIGCQTFQPDLCYITIRDNSNCTYSLETSAVPKYSFYKIRVEPETGYYIDGFRDESSWITKAIYYKSTDEENTYFILAKGQFQTITIVTTEKTKSYIHKDVNAKNFEISFSTNRTFEGDTVTFTIIPDECFYLDPNTVEVRKRLNYETSYDFEKLEFTQNPNKPNEFSFIMPDENVEIFAIVKFAITVSPRKASFSQGENILFDITNHKPEDIFDIRISDCYPTTGRSNYKTIEINTTISQTYQLPYSFISQKYSGTETGRYTLHIYPKNSGYYTETEATADFVINLSNMPEGWSTVGIKNRENYISKNSSGSFVSFSLSNIDIPNNTSLKFKYSLENNNPSETIEGTNTTVFYKNNDYQCLIYRSHIPNSINVTPFTRMVVWIEDDELKYISRKVTLYFYNY